MIKNVLTYVFNIREHRTLLIYSESEIAKRLKISRQTVSLWIKGERRKFFPQPVMRLAEKSPLWKWNDVCLWLYENKIIKNKKLVEETLFFANINAALEERDSKAREIRHHLLERISITGNSNNLLS